MRNQRGKMSGQRLSKVIVSLTLALMLLCGNFSTTAPAILNALALEAVAETLAAPVEQPQEPAPQQEAEAPVEQPSDHVPQGEIVPEGKLEGEGKPATPTTDEPTKTDAPETPAAGTPAADAPATDAPNSEIPATESAETGTSETPATDTPATDEPTKTDTPATDTPATDTPATDTPATDTPATDVPATDVPMVDERSPLQRAIEDESGAYVDVQNGKVYENQNLNKLMGVLDGGLAFATEYTVREDGEDSVRVIFRTEDDSLLIGYIPASRATELDRQQTIDKLTGNGVTFLFNKEPDLPLSVIGFTYAQPETEQGDSENPPAEEEAPTIVVEEVEPYVAAAIRNSVNLRKEPSTSGPLMAQLDKGVRMTVRGKLTNAEGELWYYVTYHQNPYYVMAELVEAVDAPTEQPAETDTETPDETEQPADEVFDFVFMAYPGELPVMITANGDDYYTHTAADGTLTLLAYGSFKGGEPAFYAVNENEIVQTDAPFGMDAPALDLTVEPDEEEAANPFVQMEYAGDPITGITANGDGYYTYTAPDGAVTLLVYGSANGGEPAFYAVDEELVINLTAPFVPEAIPDPTAAPETDDELVFMPLMPDSSAVPEYYQLVSAPSSTEEAEPAASEFLNWLIPRACAEEEVPEPTGDSDTPDENAGETQPSAPAQESTPKYIALACLAAAAVLALIFGQDLLDGWKSQQTEAQTRALYTGNAAGDAKTLTDREAAADGSEPPASTATNAISRPTPSPQPTAAPTPEPTPEVTFAPDLPPVQTPPPVQEDFLELYGQNQHFIGWLTAGERIDYPVVWSQSDNDFYLHHDFFGSADNNGTLFLNGNNRFFPANDVWLIHGHNMRSGAMFGTLGKYRDFDYLCQYPLITFRTIYDAETVYYVPIAAFDASMQKGSRGFFDVMQIEFPDDEETDEASTTPASSVKPMDALQAGAQDAARASTPAASAAPTLRHSAALQTYLDSLQKQSLWDSPADVTVDDPLLMLITCSYNHNDGRFMLVCRKLRANETPESVTALFEIE